MNTETFIKEYMNHVGALEGDLRALAEKYRSLRPAAGWMVAKNKRKVADLLDAAAVYTRLAYEVKMGKSIYGDGYDPAR